jgi:hypothetical protein
MKESCCGIILRHYRGASDENYEKSSWNGCCYSQDDTAYCALCYVMFHDLRSILHLCLGMVITS